jgi:hypothetical protein
MPWSRQKRATLIAARSSQDFAFCARAIVSEHHAQRAQISDSGRCIAGQGLFKPGNAFLDASRSRVDVPHTGQRDRSQVRNVPLVGESDRTLERHDRSDELSADAFENRDASRPDNTPSVAEGTGAQEAAAAIVQSV